MSTTAKERRNVKCAAAAAVATQPLRTTQQAFAALL